MKKLPLESSHVQVVKAQKVFECLNMLHLPPPDLNFNLALISNLVLFLMRLQASAMASRRYPQNLLVFGGSAS